MYLSISHSSRYGWWNKANVISGSCIQLLSTPPQDHPRDEILSVFFGCFPWVSFLLALTSFMETLEQHPCQVQQAQCWGAAQLTGPLGILSVLLSYTDCASSLQRRITQSRIFVLTLSVTGDCKWGFTGRPNTEQIYTERSVLWISSLFTTSSQRTYCRLCTLPSSDLLIP